MAWAHGLAIFCWHSPQITGKCTSWQGGCEDLIPSIYQYQQMCVELDYFNIYYVHRFHRIWRRTLLWPSPCSKRLLVGAFSKYCATHLYISMSSLLFSRVWAGLVWAGLGWAGLECWDSVNRIICKLGRAQPAAKQSPENITGTISASIFGEVKSQPQ